MATIDQGMDPKIREYYRTGVRVRVLNTRTGEVRTGRAFVEYQSARRSRGELMRSIVAVMAAAIAVVGVMLAPAATAEVSSACWSHLAAMPAGEIVTPAEDVRYHLSRGEESPCADSDQGVGRSSSRDGDGGKSRFCRKRWWC